MGRDRITQVCTLREGLWWPSGGPRMPDCMGQIILFARDVLRHWGCLVTGPLGSIALWIGQRICQHYCPTAASIPGWFYWFLFTLSLLSACYFAWRDSHREAEAAKRSLQALSSTENGPNVIVRYDFSIKPYSDDAELMEQFSVPFVLENLNHAAALRVKIEDIIIGSGIARFDEIPVLRRGEPIEVKAVVERQRGLAQYENPHGFALLFKDLMGQQTKHDHNLTVSGRVSYANIHGENFATIFDLQCEPSFRIRCKMGKIQKE